MMKTPSSEALSVPRKQRAEKMINERISEQKTSTPLAATLTEVLTDLRCWAESIRLDYGTCSRASHDKSILERVSEKPATGKRSTVIGIKHP